MMPIQLADGVAAQLQSSAAATATVPSAPPDPAVADFGSKVTEQAAPAWKTLNVCDPIVTAPNRGAPVVFAATVYVTVPEPDADVVPASVIQVAVVVAVQVQVDVTTNVPAAPPIGTLADPGETT
jgi:hypothetical protein